MTEDNKTNRFATLKRVAAEFSALGQLYACAHIKDLSVTGPVEIMPSKNDGMILALVKKGAIDLEINMQRHVIGKNCLVVIPHGAIHRFHCTEGESDIVVLTFSTEFLHSVNINFTAISIPTFVDHQSPAQELTTEECDLLMRYFELLSLNASSHINEQIEANIAASIAAAVVYQLVAFFYKHIGDASATKGQRSCRNAYVHDFIKLAHVHFAQERSVGFYADKLCISPKYLSLLVKEVTGKSAARWIDDLVLMEAKNLLRFFFFFVQQVAYALNFSNQSSFGKYFKHMTGQSPTEYQKS